jgi:hypothetical protein
MNAETILKIVNEESGVDIRTQTRRRDVAESRFIYFDLCRKYASDTKSLAQIGETVKRDHSSVLHGVKRCKDWTQVNKDFRFKYSGIEDLVKRQHRIYKRYETPVTASDRILYLEDQMKLMVAMQKDLRRELKLKSKRIESLMSGSRS